MVELYKLFLDINILKDTICLHIMTFICLFADGPEVFIFGRISTAVIISLWTQEESMCRLRIKDMPPQTQTNMRLLYKAGTEFDYEMSKHYILRTLK